MAELHLFRNLSKYRIDARAINKSQASRLSWAQVLYHIEELKVSPVSCGFQACAFFH